jgi:cytosine/adenosine deaminase-related metal-dependent hydrolase
VTEFDWAHSLAFANNLLETHSKSVSSRPFIFHACEGLDEAARAEFGQLLDMNVVDKRTVVIHGQAMSPEEIDKLNLIGASLITCPSSNQFLFAKHPSPDHLTNVNRLAIGSDSPLTANGDLLDEIHFCHRVLQMAPEEIFNLVTSSPASILKLRDDTAHIVPGAPANLFAVRSSPLSPAEHLVSVDWRDIELVIVAGTIRLVSDEILERIPTSLRNHLEPLSIDRAIRWIDSPIASLFEAAANVIGAENMSINGRRILLPSSSRLN